MSLVGNLKTVSFSDLLQLINSNKKTGMLSVTRHNQQKSIFFINGEIISFVSSEQEDWFVSQFLHRKSKIEKKDWDRALLLSKSSGKKIVDTLVELGLVSKQNILEAFRIRIEEIVFSIFGWKEAEFEFLEGKQAPPAAFKLKISTMETIMEGAKRIDEWSEIQKVLPSHDFSLRPNLKPPVKEGMINLTLDEYQTLLLIDGEKTLGEILMESSLGEFTTSKSLSDLISNGLIVKGEKKITNQNKRDEEKILLETIFQVYQYCFSLLERVFTQKLGQGKDELLNRLMAQQKEYYPVLGKISRKGFLDEESFFKMAEEIPKETRFHRLLDLFNSILSQFLKNLHSILGKNIRNCICEQIKKEIIPLLENQKWIVEKYQLSQEMHRVLNRV